MASLRRCLLACLVGVVLPWTAVFAQDDVADIPSARRGNTTTAG